MDANQTETPSQPIQPEIQQPPISPKPKSLFFPIFGTVVILLSFCIAGYFVYENMQLKNQIHSVTPSPTPLPETLPEDPTALWSTQKSEVLHIEFKLPPKLGLLDMSGKETPGDIGTQYCMLFTGSLTLFQIPRVYAGAGPCGGGVFNLGTVSKDYSAGRGGGFGDFTGYGKINGSYFPRFLDSVGTTALPSTIVSEETNTNGVTYLKIKGANDMQDYGGEQMNGPIYGTPGEGFIGALFNIQNDKYSGFNVYMPNNSPEDEDVFDQILSTFKFTDTVSSQQVIGIRLTQCCSCPTKIDASQIEKDGWVVYEQGKDYSKLLPKVCSTPNIGVCASCPPLETKTYTCPLNGWVDCMPGSDAKPECSADAMTWYKANCPNFKGGAL